MTKSFMMYSNNATDWKELSNGTVGTQAPVINGTTTVSGPTVGGFVTTQTPEAYTSEAHAIAIATLFIIVGTFGICGNMLVLVAVSLSKKLQTPTNAFVVNLSIADFLTCFCLPFHASGILNGDSWPLSEGMCKFVAMLTLTTPACAVLTLAMIAVNRYMLITKSKKTYQQVYRSPVIVLLVISTWFVPIATLMIPQLTKLGSIGYDELYRICKWILDLTKFPIYQTMTSLIFLGSTGVIMFCYLSIYLHVRRHIQGMKAKRKSQVLSTESISLEEQSTVSPRQRTATNRTTNGTPSLRQVKITLNLCYVVIVFFVCVVPYSVLILFRVTHPAVTYIAVVFFLSSNINPMLYAAKHPDFRVVFTCMLRLDFASIPHPSTCLRGALLKAGATPNNNKSSTES